MHITSFSLFILLTTFFFSGCSPNTLISSWNDESLEQIPIEPILVIGVAKHNETKRRIYEDTFVESLITNGTKAIASYTVSKESIKPSTKAIREVVRKSNSKTILITHMVNSDEKNFYQPSSLVIGSNNFPDYRLFTYYPFIYNSISDPGTVISTTKVILETSLFDTKTEKLIWTARTESIDPVMTRNYYQQLIDLFLADLTVKKIL